MYLFFIAKQYALECVDNKTGEITHIIKIRGISLDSDAREIINYETFQKLVHSKDSVTVERLNLKRKHTSIQTVLERKKYQAFNEKGINISGIIYPFGFKQNE